MVNCNASLTLIDTHVCTRHAGHPLSSSVWGRDVQTHECCGYQWIDAAEGAKPHQPEPGCTCAVRLAVDSTPQPCAMHGWLGEGPVK